VSDARDVLKDLVPKQHDVQTKEDRWYSMRILPYRTIDNVIDGVVVTFFEITDLKRAQQEIEKALRSAELVRRSYRQILDLVKSVIVCIDTKGKVTFLNDFAQKFFGFPYQDIINQPLIGTLVPEQEFSDMDIQTVMSEAIKDAGKPVNTEYGVMRKDGSHVRMAWTNTAIMGDDESVTGVMGIGEEIKV
jgi:two-component system CheB/CheR fusion protein